MPTAKLFRNGNSEAVRLPKECCFGGDEVIVEKVGDTVVLFPKRYDVGALRELLGGLDEDFALERAQQP